MLELGQINREDNEPPYRQIADLLRDPIRTGQWAAGDRLPSESALIHHFGVARMTVRQAVRELHNEGLVVSQQGRGVFVRSAAPIGHLASDHFVLRRRGGATDAVAGAETAQDAPVDRISVTRQKPDSAVAQRLRLTSDDEVVVRSWRSLADGQPIAAAASYIPAALAQSAKLGHVDTGPGDIYPRLDDAGHTVARFTEAVGARMPTPEERRALTVPAGVPILTVLRTAYDSADAAVEVRATLAVASAWLLEYDLTAR